MSLSSVMTAVSVMETAITGIKKAHDKAPVSLNTFPCFVNFPDSGDIKRAASHRETWHLIKMLLYVLKGADLPSAEAEVRPYLDLVLAKFDSDLTIGGTVATSKIVAYRYGVLYYAGNPYLGISFDLEALEITVKP